MQVSYVRRHIQSIYKKIDKIYEKIEYVKVPEHFLLICKNYKLS